jgi:predicted transposase YbfD/YdcC
VLDRFAACFEDLDDPRSGNAALHDFNALLIIALCTVLCGGQGAVDMALFARAKEPFLREFLDLTNGPPSHDTFSRLFRRLDPDQFRTAFQRFMTAFAETCQGVIAIDGKVLRRSFDLASQKSALHMVSAWGCEQRAVLAQIATDDKSNEITAVPKLLKMLSLKGTIVTVDALNCQRSIAQQIIDQGGDYAQALKGNQKTLHADVSLFLDDPAREVSDTDTTVDGDNGRIETRVATVTSDIGWLQHSHKWPGLICIGKCTRTRETRKGTSVETAYYLLSTPMTAARFNAVVRSHWGIENRLHWRLDVVMNEDQDRNRMDNSPYNLAILRHMAMKMMQKEGSKGSLRGKFKRAGWDDTYLRKLLAAF